VGVVALDDVTVAPYEDGRRFGTAGAYELIRAEVQLTFDPGEQGARRIVDLGAAARGPDGLVRGLADLVVLAPAARENASGRLVYVVANRGRVGAVPFARGTSLLSARPGWIDPGDGWPLERGHIVVWSGWQWDVPRGPDTVGFVAPEARGADGTPLPGQARVRFEATGDATDFPLVPPAPVPGIPVPDHYEPLDLDDPDAVLTVRELFEGPFTVVPRQDWHFTRAADGTRVCPRRGVERGLIYEVAFRPDRCPVVGAGLLAVRDVVSFLRRGTTGEGNPLAGLVEHVLAYGASQSGRFLRQFLLEGLNADAGGRPVFDGVHSDIAGGRRGEFNVRFGQPGATWRGASDAPPFASAALLANQRAVGCVPRVVFTNSASEYWRGDGWLAHGDPRGAPGGRPVDLEDPPGVRHYLYGSADHLGAAGATLMMFSGANPPAALETLPLVRAAFANLDAWVADGVEPPASVVPRVADGTAVAQEPVIDVIRALPGALVPGGAALPRQHVWDLGPAMAEGAPRYPPVPGSAYPALVSAVDDDGNELAGIRLPAVACPARTSTGWNVRPAVHGHPNVVPDFLGSRVPFARDAAQRAETGDPRASLAERYADRDDYARRARAAADALVAARHLLADDVDVVVTAALADYDGTLRENEGPSR
jgi:hypothetical protein